MQLPLLLPRQNVENRIELETEFHFSSSTDWLTEWNEGMHSGTIEMFR